MLSIDSALNTNVRTVVMTEQQRKEMAEDLKFVNPELLKSILLVSLCCLLFQGTQSKVIQYTIEIYGLLILFVSFGAVTLSIIAWLCALVDCDDEIAMMVKFYLLSMFLTLSIYMFSSTIGVQSTVPYVSYGMYLYSWFSLITIVLINITAVLFAYYHMFQPKELPTEA